MLHACANLGGKVAHNWMSATQQAGQLQDKIHNGPVYIYQPKLHILAQI